MYVDHIVYGIHAYVSSWYMHIYEYSAAYIAWFCNVYTDTKHGQCNTIIGIMVYHIVYKQCIYRVMLVCVIIYKHVYGWTTGLYSIRVHTLSPVHHQRVPVPSECHCMCSINTWHVSYMMYDSIHTHCSIAIHDMQRYIIVHVMHERRVWHNIVMRTVANTYMFTDAWVTHIFV